LTQSTSPRDLLKPSKSQMYSTISPSSLLAAASKW